MRYDSVSIAAVYGDVNQSGKEAVLIYFNVLSRRSPGSTEERHEKSQ